MSRALITESYLTGIANAIRTKLGVQNTYTPPQMAAAIESIPTGITPTGTKNIAQNGIHDVTQYASANVNVQPNLQSKTVIENGTVTPDQGYDGLSEVIVNVSGGGVLPSEYTQVEYIATGAKGPYIDTGIKCAPTAYFQVTAKYDAIPGDNNGIFGNMHGPEFVINSYGGVYYMNIGSAGRAVVPSAAQQYKLTFRADASGAYINDYYSHSVNWSTAESVSNYFLFAFVYGAAEQVYSAANARIYSCKIYDGNTLVRNFIPCYRNADNEPGMYDLVSGEFFTNDGSGSFTAGPMVGV